MRVVRGCIFTGKEESLPKIVDTDFLAPDFTTSIVERILIKVRKALFGQVKSTGSSSP